ncbi:hypothetical protein [Microbacterium sp. P01]|uniref:hypothetical protein n=1 Tax=unclassified Microbacterium TaxID=2609290 RepID=UPI0036727604
MDTNGTQPTDANGADTFPHTGLPEADSVRKDTTYGPGSERETEAKQNDPLPDGVDDDIDPDDVRAVPGTGGPDDVGDVDVDPADLNLPFRE